MVYEIVEMPEFQLRYSEAIEYLLRTFKSPQAAIHLMDELDKALSIIEADPYIKAVSSKDHLDELCAREYFVMNYVVLYRIDVDGHAVELLDFYHQTQDYERFFRQ